MGLKADPRVPESKVAVVTRAARPTELEFRRPRPDIVPSDLVRDALRESMVSFQETLDQYKSPDSSHDISDFDLIHGVTSTPRDKKSERFSTFPRYIEENDKLSRHLSNTSISSVSTNSSALPYDNPLSPEMYLASLPSSVPLGHDDMETHSITSINSEMSTHTLRNVREQMARSLVKLKEYEAQVEAIPMLQVKLSVLKEEKRLLILKLKAREAKLRRDRGEEEEMVEDYRLYEEAMETDDEDLDMRVAKMSDGLRRKYQVPNLNRRARSESPYAKCSTVHPEDFLSFQRKRSTSCGFNSDSSDVSPTDGRRYYSKDSVEFAARQAKKRGRDPSRLETSRPETVDQEVNTDPVREASPPPKPTVRDRSINTEPQPRSPPPPRKVNHGTNTLKVRSIPKGTATDLKMVEMVSNLEMENKIQEAMLKTEEEILSCPLLQKALKKVEQEALTGPIPDKLLTDQSSQVGAENLRPFVIDVGLQCKLGVEYRPPDMIDSWCQITPKAVEKTDVSCGLSGVERLGLMKTVGVGDCKVIEEPVGPSKFRTVGVCTEKWVELITSSKQTDTEDFAFKDTESPRVADMVFEPIERPEPRQRPSHLSMASMRKSTSPSLSRKSSSNSIGGSRKSSSLSIAQYMNQKTKATMTDAPPPTKDVKVGDRCETKSVSTSAMILPLGAKPALPPGSPILSPDMEKAPPINLNLCDKCDKDIHKVAQGIMSGPSPSIAPPSPDMPWLSKIPRPVEDAEAKKLKAASSTSNLSLMNRSLTSLQRSSSNLDKGYLQRSKSNLEPSARKVVAPVSGSSTPPASRRNMGTPPPHPDRVPPGSKRAPSPLARSATPNSSEKKSLIPKFSPSLSRKTPDPVGGGGAGKKSTTPASPSAENRSFIPRVVTPPALRRMFPVKDDKLSLPDRDVIRKKTINKSQTGMSNPELESPEKKPFNRQMTRSIDEVLMEDSGEETETLDEPSAAKQVSSSPSSYSVSDPTFPLPGSALFAPIKERKKAEPSKEMMGALKVLNDCLARGHTSSRSNAQMSNAVNIIQQEWFKLSSTKTSSPNATEDYLDTIEDMSKELLDRVVNLVDVNGNTALHYSVSHGNFDVVSVLLDSKVANPNILNKAGYTCSMLISLALIRNDTHGSVVRRLFNMSDVNLRASQHGQTALMLAVSHGRLDMVTLLQEAGADINIRDEDGSTALMCAAEHGHTEIVKLLLQHPDINLAATDNDGLTALSVAMEAGHRDIGVLLYANMSFSRGTSPHSSLRAKRTPSRNSTATPNSVCGRTTSSPVPPTPPVRSRRNSSN